MQGVATSVEIYLGCPRYHAAWTHSKRLMRDDVRGFLRTRTMKVFELHLMTFWGSRHGSESLEMDMPTHVGSLRILRTAEGLSVIREPVRQHFGLGYNEKCLSKRIVLS